MSIPKTKAEILSLVETNPAYREDMDFIEETVKSKNVFIGQFSSPSTYGSEVSVSLTVGMFLHELPELVFSGVPVTVVKEVIASLCEGHDFDREFLRSERSKTILGFSVIAMPITDADGLVELGLCRDYYTLAGLGSISAVQLVFSDENGAFPWSESYSESDRSFQPVFGSHGAHVAH
tara:strand:- start:13299 stop:13832 length:534 start_codon:yes stop_codon:yes gene_type:complete